MEQNVLASRKPFLPFPEDDCASGPVQGRGPAAAPKAQPCNEITDKLFLGTKACAENVGELTSRDIALTIAIGDGLQLDETEVRAARVMPRTGSSAYACAAGALRLDVQILRGWWFGPTR